MAARGGCRSCYATNEPFESILAAMSLSPLGIAWLVGRNRSTLPSAVE